MSSLNIKVTGPMVWAGEAVTEWQRNTLTDSFEINIDYYFLMKPIPLSLFQGGGAKAIPVMQKEVHCTGDDVF